MWFESDMTEVDTRKVVEVNDNSDIFSDAQT